MANPQLEDGYFKIANELGDAMCRINLSAYESRIVWFVLRKTYGFNKAMDQISLSQFSSETGILSQNVWRTVQSLIDRHILLADRTKPHKIRYSIQKDYEKWTNGISSPEIKSSEIKSKPIKSPEITDLISGDYEHLISRDEHKRHKDNLQKTYTQSDKRTASSGDQKAKDQDSRVKALIDFYSNMFKAKFGKPPVINGGKDGATFKRLLKTYSLDQLKDLVDKFFKMDDEFVKKAGFTTSVFASQINKIVSTGQPKKNWAA